MPTGQTRAVVQVTCSACGFKWVKRADSLKYWKGECHSCSSKRTAALPEQRARLRKNGLAYIERFGRFNAPKLANRRRGGTHYNWRGGVTPFRIAIWKSNEYQTWRRSVFERDNFTCVGCGTRGGDLQADHIKPFALFPELRFAISNGRTFCVPCHRKYGACVSHGKLTRAAQIFNGTAWVSA